MTAADETATLLFDSLAATAYPLRDPSKVWQVMTTVRSPVPQPARRRNPQALQ